MISKIEFGSVFVVLSSFPLFLTAAPVVEEIQCGTSGTVSPNSRFTFNVHSLIS